MFSPDFVNICNNLNERTLDKFWLYLTRLANSYDVFIVLESKNIIEKRTVIVYFAKMLK
jgi:hypothetical protein